MTNSSSIIKEQTPSNVSSIFYPDSILEENPISEISKKFIDIEIKSDKSNKKLEEHKNKEHFCCLKCKTVPIIQFKSNNEAEYKCKCGDDFEIRSIKQLLELNIYPNNKDNNNNTEDFMDCFICQKHEKNYLIIAKYARKIFVEDVSINQMIIRIILYIYLM